MKSLKQILTYIIWVVVALLLGIGYMCILLGPYKEPTNGLLYLLDKFYTFGIFHVGARIGLVIAFLYILLDVFYLKKKLKNNIKSIGVRFMLLLAITGVVIISHYILEKVIDII